MHIDLLVIASDHGAWLGLAGSIVAHMCGSRPPGLACARRAARGVPAEQPGVGSFTACAANWGAPAAALGRCGACGGLITRGSAQRQHQHSEMACGVWGVAWGAPQQQRLGMQPGAMHHWSVEPWGAMLLPASAAKQQSVQGCEHTSSSQLAQPGFVRSTHRLPPPHAPAAMPAR